MDVETRRREKGYPTGRVGNGGLAVAFIDPSGDDSMSKVTSFIPHSDCIKGDSWCLSLCFVCRSFGYVFGSLIGDCPSAHGR